MKRVLMFVLCISVLFPLTTNAAEVWYDRVTTYVGGAAIPAAKIPTIQYRVYYGPTNPPTTVGNTATDNVMLPAPDPPAGSTYWYALDASLDGATSAKSTAKSKSVPVPSCNAPNIREVK